MHTLAPFGVFMLFMFIMVLKKSLRDETGVVPADFLNRITLGKMLRILAIVILAVAVAQTVPLDLAILYAGDLLVYFEVFTAVSLLAAQGRARAAWYLIRRLAEDSVRALIKLFVAAAQKCVSHYRYAVRAQRRKRFTAISKKSDEDADPIRWGIPA
jgi:hypothetical protein